MAAFLLPLALLSSLHEDQPSLKALQAAFSRLGPDASSGSIAHAELPEFLALAAGIDVGYRSPQEINVLVTTLREELARSHGDGPYSLADIVHAAHSISDMRATPTPSSPTVVAGDLGSHQLRKLRRRLERNRLTMPMFDTKGWVRDFEKSLKMQWEIYANGLKPMHILVARSDHVYGQVEFDRFIQDDRP